MLKFLRPLPLVRTLAACSKSGRRAGFIELAWTLGFAVLSLAILAFVLVLSTPVNTVVARIFDLIGRGELLIYAASLCRTVLYALSSQMKGIPSALANQVTPKSALAVYAGLCLFVALVTYVVSAMGDIHQISTINRQLIVVFSWLAFVATVILAFVVMSLKHSLEDGATVVQREGDDDFTKAWIGGART